MSDNLWAATTSRLPMNHKNTSRPLNPAAPPPPNPLPNVLVQHLPAPPKPPAFKTGLKKTPVPPPKTPKSRKNSCYPARVNNFNKETMLTIHIRQASYTNHSHKASPVRGRTFSRDHTTTPLAVKRPTAIHTATSVYVCSTWTNNSLSEVYPAV